MYKSEIQRVVNEAVKMAENAHSNPVIVGAVASTLIDIALRPYEQPVRYELLHGKDSKKKEV